VGAISAAVLFPSHFAIHISEVLVRSRWARDQGVEGSIVTFLADTRAELTKALGMEMTHPGPMEALGNLRCKRHAAIVVDGVITAFNVSEAEGDPGARPQMPLDPLEQQPI
jgi:peroxiredoxin